MSVSDSDDEQPRAGGSYPDRYRAYVRDDNDPDKEGRVRCYCPSVMGHDSDNAEGWLGWAVVSYAHAPDASGVAYGVVDVPRNGTPVWLEFEQGRPDFPVVVGAWLDKDAAPVALPKHAIGQADAATDGQDRSVGGITVPKSSAGTPTYPRNHVHAYKNGVTVEVDESDGNNRIFVRHPSGTFVECTHPGRLVAQVLADFLLWAGASIKMGAVGDIVLAAGAKLYLKSAAAAKPIGRVDDRTVNGTLVIAVAGSGVTGVTGTYAKPGGPSVPATQVTPLSISVDLEGKIAEGNDDILG